MAQKPFKNAAKQDALDNKIPQILDYQIQELGFGGALEVFTKLAEEEIFNIKELSDLTNIDTRINEKKKRLLIQYLETFIEIKERHPEKGDNYLIVLTANARAEARIDSLTGIPNRRAFDEQFNTEQAVLNRLNQERGENSYAESIVLEFDVNGLKEVNDKLGHNAGDEFIQHFAEEVSVVLRPGEALYRVGGDEFLLIASEGGEQTAQAIIKRVRKRLDNNPFIYNDTEVTMKTGAGYAIFDPTSNRAEILNAADKMLYEDKKIQPKSIMRKSGGFSSGSDVVSTPSVL